MIIEIFYGDLFKVVATNILIFCYIVILQNIYAIIINFRHERIINITFITYCNLTFLEVCDTDKELVSLFGHVLIKLPALKA